MTTEIIQDIFNGLGNKQVAGIEPLNMFGSTPSKKEKQEGEEMRLLLSVVTSNQKDKEEANVLKSLLSLAKTKIA